MAGTFVDPVLQVLLEVLLCLWLEYLLSLLLRCDLPIGGGREGESAEVDTRHSLSSCTQLLFKNFV